MDRASTEAHLKTPIGIPGSEYLSSAVSAHAQCGWYRQELSKARIYKLGASSKWLMIKMFKQRNSCCCCLVAKSCLTLATPWTVTHQAPPSMGFPRQEYWSGLLFPPLGDLPHPGIEPMHWQVDSLLLSHQGSPQRNRGRGKNSKSKLSKINCRN